MTDTFFLQKRCDRCNAELHARIMSWFTKETICLDCSAKEDRLKKALQQEGRNPSDFEGCGYIPKVELTEDGDMDKTYYFEMNGRIKSHLHSVDDACTYLRNVLKDTENLVIHVEEVD